MFYMYEIYHQHSNQNWLSIPFLGTPNDPNLYSHLNQNMHVVEQKNVDHGYDIGMSNSEIW